MSVRRKEFFAACAFPRAGQLIKRENYQPSPPLSDQEWQSRLAILRRVVAELNKVQFPRQCTVLAGEIQRRPRANWKTHTSKRLCVGNASPRTITKCAICLPPPNGATRRLNITQCEWKDAAGHFPAHATWSRQKGKRPIFRPAAASNSNPFSRLSDSERSTDADFTFETPPHDRILRLRQFRRRSTSATQSDRPRQRRKFRLSKRCRLPNFNAEFSWDGERTLLRDVRVAHSSGELTRRASRCAGRFSTQHREHDQSGCARACSLSPDCRSFWANGSGRARPQSIWPFADRTGSRTTGRRRKDQHRPRAVPRRLGEERRAENSFRRWRGQLQQFSRGARGRCRHGSIHLRFRKTRSADRQNQKLRLRPADVIFWIDPDQWKNVTPYKFRSRPT